MSHYKSNLRDLEFNLFEVFGARRHRARHAGRFADLDADTARSVLAEVDRLAREDLAASYAVGDRNPPVFDPATHTAPMPAELQPSYQAFMDAEFWRLDLPAELGGTHAPRALWWSLAELVLGSNAPIWMYASGPSFAHTLYVEGTPEQKEWAKLFVEKRWGSTMVLTEPDAGSDVGAGRTRAIPQPDGSWHIEGVKRFITSGEHDLTDNIIHYVLARPVGVEGAGGPGTKGLSLFVVPKFHFDPADRRAGRAQRRLRHQRRAQDGPQGLQHLRADLRRARHAGQGLAARRRARGHPADVPDHRVRPDDGRHQGDRHPVDRLPQRAGVRQEPGAGRRPAAARRTRPRPGSPSPTTPTCAARCCCRRRTPRACARWSCYTAGLAGQGPAGRGAPATRRRPRRAERVNDLLLPLVKGCGSERAYELLGHEALQTFGGSGYLQDYPLEQYVRDAKIDTLYEGTTAIQSLDLIFRKIVKDGGAALRRRRRRDRSRSSTPRPATASSRRSGSSLGAALADVQGMLGTVTGWLGAAQAGEPRELYKVGLASRRMLLALGDLVVGWLLQRQAEVALAALGRRRSPRPRPRLLRGQGRLGPVLRPRGAAAPGQRPPHRRGHHAGRHGPARRSPSRRYRRPVRGRANIPAIQPVAGMFACRA